MPDAALLKRARDADLQRRLDRVLDFDRDGQPVLEAAAVRRVLLDGERPHDVARAEGLPCQLLYGAVWHAQQRIGGDEVLRELVRGTDHLPAGFTTTTELLDALAQLPDEVRPVFTLSRVERFTDSAVAERLGLSKLEVGVRLYQAEQLIARWRESDQICRLRLLSFASDAARTRCPRLVCSCWLEAGNE